jgi:hypothetical protein
MATYVPGTRETDTKKIIMSLQQIAAKFENEFIDVRDYGATGDGVTDDSVAFTKALSAGASVYAPSGTYIVHDVTIPGGTSLIAYGAKFKDAAGADHIFKLTGFGTQLLGAYISSATNCSTAAIVIDDGNSQKLQDITIVNATSGVYMQSSSNGGNGFGCTKSFLSNISVNNFSGYGLYSGPNVHDSNIVAFYADANTVSGGGGQIPKLGSTGFAFVGTGSTVAFGGNQLVNTVAINCQTGYQFTDANLDTLTNAIADSLSGIGYNLTGTTNNIILNGVHASVCAIGVALNGTGNANFVNNLQTKNIGVIPGFGGTTWFSSAGFSSFYDLSQASTGSFVVNLDSWLAGGTNAHTFTEAVAGAIQMMGGVILPFNSIGTVAAGSTVFMGLNGQSATENDVLWIQPQSTAFYVANIARIVIQNTVAPGAGQSFTYTLRVNNADSAITGSTSGAGVFQATMSGGPVSIGPLKPIAIKLVTSAAAGVARHRGYIQLIPQPS